MKTRQLIVHSLFYYWRTNVAVLLGVLTGTSVIAGALVVGDSVRGSLQQMSLDRLGDVDHVLTGPRFFRESLADELAADASFQQQFRHVAPALMMRGSVEAELAAAVADGYASSTRAGRIHVYGVDQRLWKLLDNGSTAAPSGNEMVIGSRVAWQLGVVVGDDVTLWIELPSSIPRDSLLGNRDETSRDVPLVVQAVLEESSGVGRFGLNPSQQLPLNVFVPLSTLQSALDLNHVPASRNTPHETPARVNTLFVAANSEADQSGPNAPEAATQLSSLLAQFVTLRDLDLRLVENESHDYLSLESEQQILPEVYSSAGEQVARVLGMSQSPTLVYLANEFRNADDADAFSTYSIVAGIDVDSISHLPFGPFVRTDGTTPTQLAANDIWLNDWLAADLKVQPGNRITLSYHLVGSHGELPEVVETFTVQGIIKLEGTAAADSGLVPEVEGITDADTFSDWEQPFPMDLDRVTTRDEDYWDEYRTTPKAFVTLSTAQRLWRSRYGELTSLRLSTIPNQSLTASAEQFTSKLLASLAPRQTGLLFQPVKFQGLLAARGTTPFSVLFISFSFFLIFSATLLIGLLFRLGIERRGTSVGLYTAVGFPISAVRRLFLTEAIIVVVTGGVMGVVAAVPYARLMVYGLTTWWIGAIGTPFLAVHVNPLSLAIGFAISVMVTLAAVWWAVRQLGLLSTRELLSGMTEPPLNALLQQRRGGRAKRVATISTAIAVALVIGSFFGLIPTTEAFSGFSWQVAAFFVVGMAALVASLAFLSASIDSDRGSAIRGSGMAGIARLGIRNASRQRQRSVMTVGLIASATFVIVAVAAGHRNPIAERPDKNSGNGGFSLVAESSTPILFDLNTAEGRDRLDLVFDDNDLQSALLAKTRVVPFRSKPGEDASCLNLYQTTLPTILGVPQSMIKRGGFKFADTKGDNPWTLLNEELEDGSIPVLGDMNTLQYSLHKGIGQTVSVPNAEGAESELTIRGMLDGSVFQGVLLMSEENFLILFPQQTGYQYFLIETPPEHSTQISGLLETGLTTYGFDAEPVARRLARFLAVQNTYLSTFQTLGSFGLLLGTLGLATVMLRNVLERRGELALMRAVGFANSRLAGMVLWENALLLVWGLAAGTVSALLAMTPHLASTGGQIPLLGTTLMLLAVFLVGMAASALAVTQAVRTPIVATLRSE